MRVLPFSRVRTETMNVRMKRFLRGPISLAWLERAAQAGAGALEAGIVLWFKHGICKGMPFKIGNREVSLSGKSEDTGRRALLALEQAGLIQVTRAPGRKAVVKILEAEQGEGEREPGTGDSLLCGRDAGD